MAKNWSTTLVPSFVVIHNVNPLLFVIFIFMIFTKMIFLQTKHREYA